MFIAFFSTFIEMISQTKLEEASCISKRCLTDKIIELFGPPDLLEFNTLLIILRLDVPKFKKKKKYANNSPAIT